MRGVIWGHGQKLTKGKREVHLKLLLSNCLLITQNLQYDQWTSNILWLFSRALKIIFLISLLVQYISFLCFAQPMLNHLNPIKK